VPTYRREERFALANGSAIALFVVIAALTTLAFVLVWSGMDAPVGVSDYSTYTRQQVDRPIFGH
jgi:hypothetical protein